MTAYIRYFPAEEVAAIIERIAARLAKGRTVTLKPDTAYLAMKGLQAFMAEPDRRAIVRELCRFRDGCERQCIECIGKANAIMGLYEGRKVR